MPSASFSLSICGLSQNYYKHIKRQSQGKARLLLLLVGLQLCRRVSEEDLVVRLPGQPKVLFRQYAVYVDVDSETGRSLFYYFVEADSQPETKPLTLWLNGGPGCSSVGGGAFTELGPFYPTGDGHGLRINSMSWNKASDMLVFLLRWFNKFPALKARHLFLTGESYAGHYIPQLADAIHSYNRQSSGFKINVKGIAIGNPLLKLDTDTSASYDFLWYHGIISDERRHAIIRQCDFTSLPNISKECIEALTEVSLANILVNYSGIDGNINMLPILKRIIQNKTYVWISSGDQDSVVPLLGSRTLVRELAHDLNFSTTLPYGPWFHKNQVGGWVTEYGKILTFATVRGAAHMVPYAPSRALHIFSSFVRGRRLPNSTHYSPDE
ncbi:hypothetical protein YC2023_114067 [Brassica napus]